MKKVLTYLVVMCLLLTATIISAQAAKQQPVKLVAQELGTSGDSGGAVELTNEQMASLEAQIPATYAEAEKLVEETEIEIVPAPGRFLLWTHNLEHVMWGRLYNGRFYGTDNQGVHVWGIYGKNFFAGFYGGEFFYGKYWQGMWKATGLFGVENSSGGYLVSPGNILRITPITIEE